MLLEDKKSEPNWTWEEPFGGDYLMVIRAAKSSYYSALIASQSAQHSHTQLIGEEFQLCIRGALSQWQLMHNMGVNLVILTIFVVSFLKFTVFIYFVNKLFTKLFYLFCKSLVGIWASYGLS